MIQAFRLSNLLCAHLVHRWSSVEKKRFCYYCTRRKPTYSFKLKYFTLCFWQTVGDVYLLGNTVKLWQDLFLQTSFLFMLHLILVFSFSSPCRKAECKCVPYVYFPFRKIILFYYLLSVQLIISNPSLQKGIRKSPSWD